MRFFIHFLILCISNCWAIALFAQYTLSPDTLTFQTLPSQSYPDSRYAYDRGIGDFEILQNQIITIATADTATLKIADKSIPLSTNPASSHGFILTAHNLQSGKLIWWLTGTADFVKKCDVEVLNSTIYASIIFSGVLQIGHQNLYAAEPMTAFLECDMKGHLLNVHTIPNLIFQDFKITTNGPLFCGGITTEMLVAGTTLKNTAPVKCKMINYVLQLNWQLGISWYQLFPHNYPGVDFGDYDIHQSIRFIHGNGQSQVYIAADYRPTGLWMPDGILLMDTFTSFWDRYWIGALDEQTGDLLWYHKIFPSANRLHLAFLWNPKRLRIEVIVANDSLVHAAQFGPNTDYTARYPLYLDDIRYDFGTAGYGVISMWPDGEAEFSPVPELTERIEFCGILDDGKYLTRYQDHFYNSKGNIISFIQSKGADPYKGQLLLLDNNRRPAELLSYYPGYNFAYHFYSSDKTVVMAGENIVVNRHRPYLSAAPNFDHLYLFLRNPSFYEEEYHLYIPNAFSPNDDHLNDYFFWSSLGLHNENIRIFNTNGRLLYKGAGAWNGNFGRVQPPEVLIYIYEAETINGQKISRKGYIHLLK